VLKARRHSASGRRLVRPKSSRLANAARQRLQNAVSALGAFHTGFVSETHQHLPVLGSFEPPIVHECRNMEKTLCD
jgi:hypothetical protein